MVPRPLAVPSHALTGTIDVVSRISGQDPSVMTPAPGAVLLTGIQAAGKTTVGKALARRLDRSAFIEGDLLWQMVVSGREDMATEATTEAVRQLELRYRHGAMLACSYARAGFTAIHVDNIYGPAVTEYLSWLDCPAALVVLRPSPEAVAAREEGRDTSAYGSWVAGGATLLDAVRRFDAWLAETPPIGLWVDSSDQTVDETVDWILAHWDEALIDVTR